MKLPGILRNIFGYIAHLKTDIPIYCVLDEDYNNNVYEGAEFELVYFHAVINRRLIAGTNFAKAVEKRFIGPMQVHRNGPELFNMLSINPQDVNIEAIKADLKKRNHVIEFSLDELKEEVEQAEIAMPKPIKRDSPKGNDQPT